MQGKAIGSESELRALSWSAFSSVGGAIIAVGRAVLLSRLLLPADFGLFGLAFFAVSAISTLTDLGLGRLGIVAQFDGPVQQHRFLDTVWTAQVLRGVALTGVVAALAGQYAVWVRQPQLTPMLIAIGAWLLISALASPAGMLLHRQLQQRALALVRVGSDLFGLLVSVVLAWKTPSGWALVVGLLAGASLATVLSYAVHPFRPRFSIDGAQFRRNFSQGRHMAIVTAMTFVTTQVDNLLVGRMLGAVSLGLYLFAYRLAMLPVEQMQSIVSSVAMPVFARHRDAGPVVLAGQLNRLLTPATTLLCAGLVPALMLRHELVRLVGGTRWDAAASLLLPLMVLALLRCTAILLGTLLQSVGRAELDARGKVFEAALFIPGCAFAVLNWGLAGACWAGAMTYALAVVQRTLSVGIVLPGQALVVTRGWGRSALAATLCVAAGFVAEHNGVPTWWVAPAALAAYVTLAGWLNPQLRRQFNSLRTRLR